jgi:hypothetical protein
MNLKNKVINSKFDNSSSGLNQPLVYPRYLAVTSEGSKVNLHYHFMVFSKQDSSIGDLEEKKLKVLVEAVKGYKKTLDYNGTYIAYLLDQISEDEFSQESEKYMVKLTKQLDDDTIDKIKFLFRITNERFTPSEISNIFLIDEDTANDILNRLEDDGSI